MRMSRRRTIRRGKDCAFSFSFPSVICFHVVVKHYVIENLPGKRDGSIIFKLSFYGQLLTCIVIYNAPCEIGRPCKYNLRWHFETALINAKNGKALAPTNG